MPRIRIKGKRYTYKEDDVISFGEGLIGLPQIRRAVVLSMNEFKPFQWLVSVDNENYRFIVVNPNEIFESYQPALLGEFAGAKMQTLAIVKISSDWRKTTINLKAPIFINEETMRAEQRVLTDGNYRLAESLPQN